MCEIQERKYYLDLIKLIAIVFVIYNHTGQEGYLSFLSGGAIWKNSIKMVFSAVCKTAVPLFFMCSGALLIPKHEKISDLLRKRVFKYVGILVVFSLLYYIVIAKIDNAEISLIWFFKYIYSTQTMSYSGAYWFLYSYISFLLLLPFLRLMAENMQEQHVQYLLGVYLFFRLVLPIVEHVFGLSSVAINVSWMTNNIFMYPILGYYIDHILSDESFANKVFLSIFAFVSLAGSVLSSLRSVKNGDFNESDLCFLNVFLILSIFYYCKNIKINRRLGKIVSEFGKSSFGIYLLHGYAFLLLKNILPYGGLGSAIIRTGLVFLISYLMTVFLRRIPIVRNVLG